MSTSIVGADGQAELDKARVPGFKSVQVGKQVVEIPSPFPSPEDWRDTIMHFLLVDRFNNPLAPPKNLPGIVSIAIFKAAHSMVYASN